MKNKNKTMYYVVAGALTIGIFGVTILQKGSLFQGNFSGQHFSASNIPAAFVTMLVPTSQIRKGEMSFLKFSIAGGPDATLEKMKVNIRANDINISNIRLFRNEKDVTALLTPESRMNLKDGIQAKGKSTLKILTIDFASNINIGKESNIFELRNVTEFVSKDSTLKVNIIDSVIKEKDRKSVVKGPEEMTSLGVSYLPAGESAITLLR